METQESRRLRVLSAHLGHGTSQCTTLSFQNCGSEQQHPKALFESEGVEVVGDVQDAGTIRTLQVWHKAVQLGMAGHDGEMMELVDSILSDNILFLAPTYHKERRDKTFVKFALVGVTKAFKNFRYTRAFLGNEGFALEFSCNIETEDGPFMRGIDLVSVGKDGKIEKFEVMARPPKSVLKLLDFQTKFLREMGIIPPSTKKK